MKCEEVGTVQRAEESKIKVFCGNFKVINATKSPEHEDSQAMRTHIFP